MRTPEQMAFDAQEYREKELQDWVDLINHIKWVEGMAAQARTTREATRLTDLAKMLAKYAVRGKSWVR